MGLEGLGGVGWTSWRARRGQEALPEGRVCQEALPKGEEGSGDTSGEPGGVRSARSGRYFLPESWERL